MSTPPDRLSPRQRDCLRLVWERQATSKEIAAELGIRKSTVDGYIAEAVEQLGASDRRNAAAIVFGDAPRAVSGGNTAGVGEGAALPAAVAASTDAFVATRPWRTHHHPRNTLTLAQTIGWVAAIAIGSLAALALATSVGNGLPSVAEPLVHGVQRLTH